MFALIDRFIGVNDVKKQSNNYELCMSILKNFGFRVEQNNLVFSLKVMDWKKFEHLGGFNSEILKIASMAQSVFMRSTDYTLIRTVKFTDGMELKIDTNPHIDWEEKDINNLINDVPNEVISILKPYISIFLSEGKFETAKQILYHHGKTKYESELTLGFVFDLITKYEVPQEHVYLLRYIHDMFVACGKNKQLFELKFEHFVNHQMQEMIASEERKLDVCSKLLSKDNYANKKWKCGYCGVNSMYNLKNIYERKEASYDIFCDWCKNHGIDPLFFAQANESKTFSVDMDFGIVKIVDVNEWKSDSVSELLRVTVCYIRKNWFSE